MIDLHFHSIFSDGSKDIPTIASEVREHNLKYFSLTDHDTVDSYFPLKDALGNSDCVLIPGVELTCLFRGYEIHILAYDFDIKKVKQVLGLRNKIVSDQKNIEMAEAKEKWKDLGYVVNDILPEAKRPVGYTIGKEIYTHEENLNKMRRVYGKVLDVKSFYNEFQAIGKPCHTKRSGVDLKWIMENIRPLVHDMIIAHPFVSVSLFVKPIDFKIIEELISIGLDGIEIYHNNTDTELITKLESFVKDFNLCYTGGSDNHGKPGDTAIGHYSEKLNIPSFRLSNHELL